MKGTRSIPRALALAVLFVAGSWLAIPGTAFAQASSVLAIRWNPALTREEFGDLNTTTGAFAYRGTIGDLQSWNGQSFVNGTTLYVLGNGAASGNLYIMN